MSRPGINSRRLGLLVSGLGLAILCSGALAAGASAASLSVSIKPTSPHARTHFKVTTKGNFKKSELKGKAYLVEFEVSGPACKATAQKESAAFGTGPLFRYGPAPKSPFKVTDSFTAGTPGPRHVCAYLYAQKITATSTVQPIATAFKSFNVVR